MGHRDSRGSGPQLNPQYKEAQTTRPRDPLGNPSDGSEAFTVSSAAAPFSPPFPGHSQRAIPAETLPPPSQIGTKATNSRKPSPGCPEPGKPGQWRAPAQAPSPGTRVKYNQGNQIFNIWKKISASGGQGSPDQVEGQPVYDEGLEGRSSQGQVELEALPGSWAPHGVGAQGRCSKRAHLRERRALRPGRAG